MANVMRPVPPLPSGYVNYRSGLITKMGAGGRKVYVKCQDDGCEGCPDRHFIMEWQDSTQFSVDNRAVKETEWTERLEEGVDRIKRIREGG